MRQHSIALIISALAASLALTMVPDDAHAMGFDVNLKIKGGYETAPEDLNADGAFAFGAETSILLGLIPVVDLTFGPYFSGNWANHTPTETEADGILNIFAIGGKARFETVVIIEIHAGYAFGNQSVEVDGVSISDVSVDGYHWGAFLGYGFPIIPELLQLEVGPYFDQYWLKADNAPDEVDRQAFNNFGVAIQGNFGF